MELWISLSHSIELNYIFVKSSTPAQAKNVSTLAKIEYVPLGDQWILINCSQFDFPLKIVHLISQNLFNTKPNWAQEIVPGMVTLAIKLNTTNYSAKKIREEAIVAIENLTESLLVHHNQSYQNQSRKTHVVKICYDLEVALDLKDCAQRTHLSIDNFIQRHQAATYTVDILGFMPGFAYLSGLDPQLSLPRRPTPRPAVPAGSVAIAENQTAIYPRDTPGGWNIIGKSPIRLFDSNINPPTLFMPGDLVKLEQISLDELHQIEQSLIRNRFTSIPVKNDAMIEVLQAGALTTIQDAPRIGFSHWAVGPGGAVDQTSLKLANALVGNSLDTAALEITSTGPKLQFTQSTLLAWVGAQCLVNINGISMPSHRPIWVPENSILSIGHIENGFRVTLAIAGGLDISPELGRCGSHLAAGLGPPLIKRGDLIPIKRSELTAHLNHHKKINIPKWQIKPLFEMSLEIQEIKALPGRHLSLLSPLEQKQFWETVWTVSKQSNRMGIRLDSDFKPSEVLTGIPSEAIGFGTLQFPPSHQAIILLAEHQTTGGYPRFAEVIESEHMKLAQLQPSKKIKFAPITLEQADELNLQANIEFNKTLNAAKLGLNQFLILNS